MSNLKTIQCPNCGSKKVKYLDDSMFECINCQTSFYVDSNQTAVNHKHTYNNTTTAKPINLKSRRALIVFLGLLVLGFLLLIPVLFLTTNNKSSGSGFSTSESSAEKDYNFNVSSSAAFTDQSKNLKIFVIGTIQSSNYNDNKYKDKLYWAVYDAVKGTYDQITPLESSNSVTNNFNRAECFKFDDGNIYTIVGNTMLYKYDAVTKSMYFLNNDIISSVKEMQSGISNIDDATHAYSAFKLKSNSDKEIMYYPISKVYYADNFRQTVVPQSYPNEKPTTFFFQTNNQPSYLVKYNAMYSMGYPFCFDPHIESVFDENENFKSAEFSNYWVAASHLINMEVLNTDNKVYDMTLLDFRDGIVAVGIKTNNISTEKFKIQWQDYNGKLLWSSPSEVSHLYDFSGAISKSNGLLFGNDEDYNLYNNQGKFIKKLDLDELSFDLD